MSDSTLMRILLIPLSLLLLSIGCGPKQYTATATLQILTSHPITFGSAASEQAHYLKHGMPSKVAMLESDIVLQRVADRLAASDFVPHTIDASLTHMAKMLDAHRSVKVITKGTQLLVSYKHPDAEIAAFVANTFADVFIEYDKELSIVRSMNEVENLRLRADQQLELVEELEKTLINLQLNEDLDPTTVVSLQREFDVQQTFLQALLNRIIETSNASANRETARILERASVPNN